MHSKLINHTQLTVLCKTLLANPRKCAYWKQTAIKQRSFMWLNNEGLWIHLIAVEKKKYHSILFFSVILIWVKVHCRGLAGRGFEINTSVSGGHLLIRRSVVWSPSLHVRASLDKMLNLELPSMHCASVCMCMNDGINKAFRHRFCMNATGWMGLVELQVLN